MARLAAVVVALAVAGGMALADPIVDQSYTPSLPTGTVAQVGVNNLVDWAQTFTVGTTGTLTKFQVAVKTASDSANAALLIDLRTTTGGVPTDPDSGTNILVSTSVLGISSSGFTILDVVAGVPVSSGDVLAIVLRSNDTNSPGIYQWPGTAANGYAGGSAFVRISSWGPNTAISDLWFQTFVDTGTPSQTPEPAILVLLAAGLVLVAWRRRGAL